MHDVIKNHSLQLTLSLVPSLVLEVWTSERGYDHRKVGRKVAQIQAVLARRCASIGELQEHLLRAGWQRGVAQWGVLGDGGQWAAVAGFGGALPDRQRRQQKQATKE